MPIDLSQPILLFVLASVAVGGLAYVFLYPLLSGERTVEQRRANVAQHQPVQRAVRGQQKTRREQVEQTLKELEQREQKNKKLSLQQRISQAGLSWSKQRYMLISAGSGLAVALLVLGLGFGLLPALGLGFAG